MNYPVWIILVLFIIQIIYSIIASFISRGYREIYYKNKALMGIYFFITIIVLAFLLIYGTHCSIVGDSVDNSCKLYTWLLTFVIFVIIIYTIIRSSILIAKEKKNKENK